MSIRHGLVLLIVINGLIVFGCATHGAAGRHRNMNADPITHEVESLHAFFAAWFRGELEPSAFARFESALDDDFVIVTPAGRSLDRTAILDLVRNAFGRDPGSRIWIEDVRIRRHAGDTVIATYEEWQQSGEAASRGRISTAVLRIDAEAPNGVRWMHVHETWLPPGQ